MVYVDRARNEFRGMIMCHMFADTGIELHQMAEKLDLSLEWFQSGNGVPHYDLSLSKRAQAVKLGAEEIGIEKAAEIIRRLRGMTNER